MTASGRAAPQPGPDPRKDPRWKYDGRLYCALHRDTALARWRGEGPLVCPLCPDGDAVRETAEVLAAVDTARRTDLDASLGRTDTHD